MTARLNGHCPNCGGELVRRPVRPEEALRRHPASTLRRHGQTLAGIRQGLSHQPEPLPDPLLLPYRVLCWRARVDHTELTAPLDLPDDGLQIQL